MNNIFRVCILFQFFYHQTPGSWVSIVNDETPERHNNVSRENKKILTLKYCTKKSIYVTCTRKEALFKYRKNCEHIPIRRHICID